MEECIAAHVMGAMHVYGEEECCVLIDTVTTHILMPACREAAYRELGAAQDRCLCLEQQAAEAQAAGKAGQAAARASHKEVSEWGACRVLLVLMICH